MSASMARSTGSVAASLASSSLTGNKRKKKRQSNKKLPVPLAPPPEMRSRKRARVVTTLFHSRTHKLEEAQKKGDKDRVAQLTKEIIDMGGREEYQRASRLSTSHHSTSKWVMGILSKRGWLPAGIPLSKTSETEGTKKEKRERRNVHLLEVGAINTELVDAARRTKRVILKNTAPTKGTESNSHDVEKRDKSEPSHEVYEERPVYHLDVRAIDLRSCHELIEETDFLTMPLIDCVPERRYDVIVCSMVLNCVPTPQGRGKMLALLYHQLRPGGICCLTIPRLCLNQSKYLTQKTFNDLLETGVGFHIQETKESPKVAFFVLQRPSKNEGTENPKHKNAKRWKNLSVVNNGKKFRNTFAIILNDEEVNGSNLF
eukprot:scaffold72280_cov54-Attheya_sp.AAC.5